ncbi:hypothetical protein H5410_000895 [Solanum commersonii]|uniref:Uncharacterized protein n=1 Tax=Solanum commersonii TaxID=4109 RepID=A0A9J6AY18_SOLCO|nr:hypothetical protein H5410_000895 [Solanum commersonii]
MTNEGDVNVASTTNIRLDASDDEHGDEAIDITAGEEWVARVEMARQTMEILGRRLNEKNKSWVWSEECQRVLENLKAAVTKESILTLLNF